MRSKFVAAYIILFVVVYVVFSFVLLLFALALGTQIGLGLILSNINVFLVYSALVGWWSPIAIMHEYSRIWGNRE